MYNYQFKDNEELIYIYKAIQRMLRIMEIHELHQVYEIRTKPGRQFYRIFEIRNAHETAVVEGFGGCIGAVFCQVVGGKAEEVHNPRTEEGENVSHLSRKSQKVALFLF